MKLSISTCWNSQRHTDGYEMLVELAELGFEYAELSHGIRLSLVPGIFQALEEEVIKISSVHNFCPLPPGVMGAAPNLYEPTGTGRQEKHLWLRHTLKTIDFAHQVGADLMVFHSGSVRFWWRDPEAKLEAFRTGEDRSMGKYDQVREQCLKRIRKAQAKYRRQLTQSLGKILPACQEKGVRVGIENREGLTELPLDLEMTGLLKELGEPEIFGYWHDAGHAQLKEMMGIMPHRQLLAENADRQFGFHLHDVSAEERDHQPLGTGTVNWSMIRDFVRPHHLVVLELNPKLRSEQVKQSQTFATELLEDRLRSTSSEN